MADESELLDYEDEEQETVSDSRANGEAPVKKAVKGAYVTIHSSGFRDFILKPELLRAIVDCGFEHPSEVQHECIPQAILSMDVLCQAKSGMGKTAVFVIATLQQLDPEEDTNTSVLVLCHTRELAFQISKEYERFSKYMPKIKVGVFFGGLPIRKDIETLSKSPVHIVVGTPGRILDLIRNNALKLQHIKHFIIDECDKMLDTLEMRRDIQDIFRMTPHQKQVMMFSATMSKEIRPVCRNFMQDWGPLITFRRYHLEFHLRAFQCFFDPALTLRIIRRSACSSSLAQHGGQRVRSAYGSQRVRLDQVAEIPADSIYSSFRGIAFIFHLLIHKPLEIFIENDSKLTLHGLRQHYVKVKENEKNRKLFELLDELQFNQVSLPMMFAMLISMWASLPAHMRSIWLFLIAFFLAGLSSCLQVIIFVKSVQRCMALSQLLVDQNFPAIAMHRAMTQEERLDRYQAFKNFQKRLLVATNLFGRGMDIERVNIVFNYDMPEDSDTYLHRVARAGRFGTKGLAITFVSDEVDAKILNEVQNRFEVNISELPDVMEISSYMEDR
ncbi:hypothetical protein EG68_01682 [Paragonimus skrjabini miyazakii]|uniref:RNA helicase n=1 Tax=Paragonimus skrjabini miyazakii TaxID=59628 RepID=A0A8S9Z696_9TREM|nr:hypothetical protein EG68_01682 [Paragonimus skrjabini miyazakii]